MTIKKQEFITEIYFETGQDAAPVAFAFAYTEKASVNEAIAVFNSFELDSSNIVSMETYEIPQHFTANEMA
tara:strand:+ start:13137 stop:13349 length:213 start_codon:yes stop_codon:yes gene_type:complete